MKKTAVNDAEPDRLHKSALPKLRYHQALALYVVTRSGEVRTVRAATAPDICDLVEACIPTAKEPKACAGALNGLDYTQLLDRWYALDTLRVYGAALPLYTTIEEAQRSSQKAQAIA